MKDDKPKDIYNKVDEIANDMERLFYHLFCPKDPAKSMATRKWHPLADIIETEDKVIIKVELAGVNKTDISITLEKNHLLISGSRKEILPPNVKCYQQMEVNYGEFERILPLKPGIAKSSIEAKLGNGFLTIIINANSGKNNKKTLKVDIK